MRAVLAVLLLVGAVWSSSIHNYGWAPRRELLYRFESQVLTGIPEINHAQLAGIKLSAIIRVQAFEDYSLRVKFEKSKFFTLNGEVNLSHKGRLIRGPESEQNVQVSEIPADLKKQLEKPFLVHMKHGLVENFYVDRNEVSFISNIKRSFLSQIQLDVSGARRNEIESNHIPLENGLESEDNENIQADADLRDKMTYFTTNEETVLGDCQTSYTMHPLPKYQSMELEQEWREEEKNIFEANLEQLPPKGEDVCQGKEYFKISKSKNLNNCKKNPFFQSYVGMESKCDGSQSGCTDTFTHLVSTTCYVCGNLEAFTVRKCLKKDIVSLNPMGWNTNENVKRSTTIVLDLIKENSSFKPLDIQETKKKSSLIYEFHERDEANESYGLDIEELGIKAILPLPKLKESTNWILRTAAHKDEIKRKIVEEFQILIKNVFESPESCSASGDAAGSFAALSKYITLLDFDDLNSIKMEIIAAQPDAIQLNVAQNLFYDIISSVGTNPSALLIMEDILSEKVSGSSAVNALQEMLRSIKTPTEELLHRIVSTIEKIVEMAHETPSSMYYKQEYVTSLYSVALVQMSNLLYRGCIHPSRKNLEFPVRIYGQFCEGQSSEVVQKFTSLLSKEIMNPTRRQNHDEHFLLVATSALGKLGNVQGLYELTKVIEGSVSERTIARVIGVYSLKRIAKLNPVLVRPILLSIIDNPAETPEVRIAAVSVLPWSQPSVAQLQKIAVRTWFDPSKQVSSFIYSTLKNLESTEVPELKALGHKARSVVEMVKHHQYGVQFSQNLNYGDFVNYLKTAISKKVSWVYSEDEVVPAKIATTSKIFLPSASAHGLTFSMYIQGMDNILQKMLYPIKSPKIASVIIDEELEEIARVLKVEAPKEKEPMAFLQSRFFGREGSYTFNNQHVSNLVAQMTDSYVDYVSQMQKKQHFSLARFIQILDVQHISPSSAGFLTFTENVLPLVASLKGSVKSSDHTAIPYGLIIPRKVEAELVPVFNAKLHSHTGIMCPLTDKFVGVAIDAAVHLSAPFKVDVEHKMDELKVVLKAASSGEKAFESVHLYINPFSVVKSLRNVKPLSQASSLKTILSKSQPKKIEERFGRNLGISGKVHFETDADFADYIAVLEKLQKHKLVSIPSLAVLPSSVRRSSLKIVIDPADSETKAFAFRMSTDYIEKVQDVDDNDYEVQASYNDENLIQKLCHDQYEVDSDDYLKCEALLGGLQGTSSEARQICQQYQLENDEIREKCHKTASICHKALQICSETQGYQFGSCQTQNQQCLYHVHHAIKLNQELQQIRGEEGHVRRLHLSTELEGHASKKAVNAIISYTLAHREQKRLVDVTFGIEIDAPHRAFNYEVSVEVEAKLPKVDNRWNTSSLLRENLEVEIDGKVRYGRRNDQKEINYEIVMKKTEEQKKSVKESQEFARCIEEEEQNRILSPVCMKVRNQASSLDQVTMKVQLPQKLIRSPAINIVEDLIKAKYFSQVSEHHSSNVRENEISIRLDISRSGEEAQVEVHRHGKKLNIKNIRLPSSVSRMVPLSIRNSLADRIVQKLTHNQEPSTCRIEPDYIATFDNKTYDYQLNDCSHLLFMDRSRNVPVAVLARQNSQSQSKIVEILAGPVKTVIKPMSHNEPNGLDIQLSFIGRESQVEIREGETKVIKCNTLKHVLVIVRRYKDNVYSISYPREFLQIITDGVRIEIAAPRLVGGRSCGLCGDQNGESSADLKSPKQCLMKKDRFVGYSYIVNKPLSKFDRIEPQVCSGIPSHDKENYEQSHQECIKKHEVWTKLSNIYNHLWQTIKPTYAVHLVEKQVGNICISKQKVNICSAKTLQHQVPTVYREGLQPLEAKQRLVEYVCIPVPSAKAYNLEKRARGGDNLNLDLQGLPVMFSRNEYEPTSCRHLTGREREELDQQHQEVRRREHPNQYQTNLNNQQANNLF